MSAFSDYVDSTVLLNKYFHKQKIMLTKTNKPSPDKKNTYKMHKQLSHRQVRQVKMDIKYSVPGLGCRSSFVFAIMSSTSFAIVSTCWNKYNKMKQKLPTLASIINNN